MNILVSKDGGVEGLSALPATSTLSIQPDNNKPQRNCLANLIKLGLMGVSLFTLPLSGYAAISAATSQTILGTEPYFVLIDGTTRTPLTSTNELLGFGYIDKDGNAKTADASMVSTTIVVDANMTHDQLITLVARDGNAHSLNGLLGATGSSLGIDDDDGDATGVTAYGSYSAKLTKDGTLVPATDTNRFDGCGVYKLELKTINDTTLGKIRAKTTYGAPDYKDYTQNTVTYTLEPDITTPYTCNAQPANLAVRASGGAPEWDNVKGFFPASTSVYPTTNTTTKNFPTTGFHGAEFKLTVVGSTAKQVILDTATTGISTTGTITKGTYTTTSSDLSLELSTDSATPNVLSVMLTGPNMNTLPTVAHTPATFTLKSGTTTIYSFKVDKWFIARYNVDSSYNGTTNPAITYCSTTLIGGGLYKVPSARDYTNSIVSGGNGSIGPGGGYGGNFKRAIGGGLFAEWGFTYRNIASYPSSDFESDTYWASESYSSSYQYQVSTYDGFIIQYSSSGSNRRAACVSP